MGSALPFWQSACERHLHAGILCIQPLSVQLLLGSPISHIICLRTSLLPPSSLVAKQSHESIATASMSAATFGKAEAVAIVTMHSTNSKNGYTKWLGVYCCLPVCLQASC